MKNKILIIEDEKMVADLYKSKLMEEGFDVYYTVSAEEGIRLSKKIRPDLIIFDILLAHEEGADFLEELKKEKETSSIPVIVLSSSDAAEIKEQATSLGAKECLVKTNLSPEEILEKINGYLKK